MPFSTTASLVSTDFDNMLRGLTHDNSDASVTNTVAEVDLKSFTIPGNTIGPTGAFHIIACGTAAGVAGSKSLRLRFAGLPVCNFFNGAVDTDWFFDVWCYNKATNARRWFGTNTTSSGLTSACRTTTTAIDTTANQILKVTGQLGNEGDSIIQTMFNVFVVQVT